MTIYDYDPRYDRWEEERRDAWGPLPSVPRDYDPYDDDLYAGSDCNMCGGSGGGPAPMTCPGCGGSGTNFRRF